MTSTEEHDKAIRLQVFRRLQELGIADQIPSEGVLRLIARTVMEYWSDMDEDDDDYDEPDLSNHTLHVALNPHAITQERQISAVDEEGNGYPIALVLPDEDAMFVRGHKITVDSDGEVLSHHRDGSACGIGCPGCTDPDLYVLEVDGESYVRCSNCGTRTQTQDDKFLAIVNWLIGKVVIPDEKA
jgi:hypothetical protein